MLSEINMKAVASHHHERMRWVVVAIDDLRSISRPRRETLRLLFPDFHAPWRKGVSCSVKST